MTVLASLTDHFGLIHEPHTAGVTLGDLLMYFVLSFNVGRARSRYKVQAPSVDGPPEFRRIFRVHMNTLEQMALHLPLLWLAAFLVSDNYAALAGCVWLIGRIFYAYDYYRDAKTRHRGFFIALAANAILFLGAVAGVIKAM